MLLTSHSPKKASVAGKYENQQERRNDFATSELEVISLYRPAGGRILVLFSGGQNMKEV